MEKSLKFMNSRHLINACPAGFQTSGSMRRHTSACQEGMGVQRTDRVTQALSADAQWERGMDH